MCTAGALGLRCNVLSVVPHYKELCKVWPRDAMNVCYTWTELLFTSAAQTPHSFSGFSEKDNCGCGGVGRLGRTNGKCVHTSFTLVAFSHLFPLSHCGLRD